MRTTPRQVLLSHRLQRSTLPPGQARFTERGSDHDGRTGLGRIELNQPPPA